MAAAIASKQPLICLIYMTKFGLEKNVLTIYEYLFLMHMKASSTAVEYHRRLYL